MANLYFGKFFGAFGIGIIQEALPMIQLGGVFLDASDVLERTDTRWHYRGPTITVGGVEKTSEYYVYGKDLGTQGATVPTSGTITGIVHFGNDPGQSTVLNGTVFNGLWGAILDVSITASTFATAVAAGTLADLLLAGNDLHNSNFLNTATIRGGAGDDTLYSFADAGVAYGEDGNDRLVTSGYSNLLADPLAGATLDGGAGDDVVGGGIYNDMLFGGADNDRIFGLTGDDSLIGGTGRDRLLGGQGADTIFVIGGEDADGEVLDGGTDSLGSVDVLYAAGVPTPIDLSSALLINFERLDLVGTMTLTRAQYAQFARIDFFGSATLAFADPGFVMLTDTPWYEEGEGNDQRILGSAGNDVIIGRDLVDVGPAVAGRIALSAADTIDGGAGNDRLYGGGGNDTLAGSTGNDLLAGEDGNDSLLGGDGNDVLRGGAGNDQIRGGIGNDRLEGGAGINDLRGEAGNDVYVVDGFASTIVEVVGAAGGIDAIIARVNATLPSDVENWTTDIAGAIDGTGNALGNVMNGNAAANTLSGLNGNDVLRGQGGNDTLSGGDDNDRLEGGADADVLTGGVGADALYGGTGADRFLFDAAAESAPGLFDVIYDFEAGIDDIVLTGIDANETAIGNQNFSGLVAAFALNQPGTLRVVSTQPDRCILYGNTDNDTAAEFVLLVIGTNTLTAGDIVL